MNKYKVEYSREAVKNLKKMDYYTKTMIYHWIDQNLVNCVDPFAHGKPLKAKYKGLWRYRVGDYRIITEIFEENLVIDVIRIGHRRSIYKK